MSALLKQLELLTGQVSDMNEFFDKSVNLRNFEKGPIGVSQINELLLTAGFDRITQDYFSLIYNGHPTKYSDGLRITGIEDLSTKVEAIGSHASGCSLVLYSLQEVAVWKTSIAKDSDCFGGRW